MNCIKCKIELPDGAKFCPMCGKKQQPEPRKRRKRANGTGTIYKLAGNRAKPWVAKRDDIYIGTYRTYHDAQKDLERLTDTDITDRFNMTFAQIYALWKIEHDRELTEKGIRGYVTAYNRSAALHERKFRSLRASDFQGVVITMENDGLAKSSCEKAVQLFSQLCKWAMREGICNVNYAKFVTITATQKSKRKPFTDAQVGRIQESKHFAAKIACILLGSGCRPNELFKVPLENCHDNYFISGSKTEAGRERIIPVTAIAQAAYADLLAIARERGCRRLIDAYEGNRTATNYAKRDWKALMAELEIEGMTPYNCRHTFATSAVRAGVKPELLQAMLGHASYSTTIDHYTHLELADVLDEAGKITVGNKLSTCQKQVNGAR